MSDETTLLPCPFCGGEAETLTAESMYGGYLFGIMCNDCRSRGDVYDTEAEAIAAWNARAPVEYDGWFYLPKPKESIVQYGAQRIEKTEHGYKVTQPVEVIESAIRSWSDDLSEYIMKRICEAWSTSTRGMLTAEQVREAIEANSWAETSTIREFNDSSWQAIADELNARGERTCRIVEYDEAPLPVCSECGAVQPDDFTVYYCWSCGCKVVDA